MPDDDTQEFKPIWIRVTSLYFILWGCYHIILSTMLATGVIAIDIELYTSDYIFTGALRLISAIYIVAGAAFLLRRRVSVTIFVIAVIANIFVYTSFLAITGSSPLGSLEAPYKITEWIVLIVTTVYAWRLERDGILT
jgi:hypothetical protein